jgi:DNA-binding CsgD family transcriptional regulator
MALSDKQYRSVLDLVGDAHDAQDLDDLRGLMLPALRRLVPADWSSYNEVTAGGHAPVTIADPELPAFAYEAWERHATTNPLLAQLVRTRDTRPYRFSDVVDMRVLRATPLYLELYKPLGVEHQIAFGLPSPPTLTIGIALSRGGPRNFSDDERTMLDLARPHLIQAYRNAQLRERLGGAVDALKAGLERRGIAALVVDPAGVLVLATGRAPKLVRELTGRPIREGRALPPEVAALMEGSRPAGEPALTHIVGTPDGTRVLLIDSPAEALEPALLESLGLTAREAAVLSRLAHGLSTADVAEDLGVRPRTVHKHCERIHRKLGVRDRAGAVATAWAATVAGRA